MPKLKTLTNFALENKKHCGLKEVKSNWGTENRM